MKAQELTLKTSDVKAIEKALNHGDRIELIPLANGVKILKIDRQEIKI